MKITAGGAAIGDGSVTVTYDPTYLEFKNGENVEVSVTLKNTGKYEGKEVAQLYIHDEFASVARPVKELKGFQLVNLKPGESKVLKFVLTDKELGFYNNNGVFVVEPGSFKVLVGGNSQELMELKFEVN